MADPLTAAELEHARWLAANRPDVTSSIVARLLDTVDALTARLADQPDAQERARRSIEGWVEAGRRGWTGYSGAACSGVPLRSSDG